MPLFTMLKFKIMRAFLGLSLVLEHLPRMRKVPGVQVLVPTQKENHEHSLLHLSGL